MSIWISRACPAPAALLSLVLILSGCMQVPGGTAPEKIAVAQGDVVVAGPRGYCVDTRATGGDFVLLASCASVTGDADAPRPRVPALLTATVTQQTTGEAPISAQTGQLKAFFASPAGRAALARDGRAESVRVIRTSTRDGVFIIHARDSSPDSTPGLSEDVWRAIFDVNGQIVSASVSALEGHPISDDAGLATLSGFAARILSESRGPTPES
ncbi:hypothetical protein [Actibacterium sp. D379-3]